MVHCTHDFIVKCCKDCPELTAACFKISSFKYKIKIVYLFVCRREIQIIPILLTKYGDIIWNEMIVSWILTIIYNFRFPNFHVLKTVKCVILTFYFFSLKASQIKCGFLRLNCYFDLFICQKTFSILYNIKKVDMFSQHQFWLFSFSHIFFEYNWHALYKITHIVIVEYI